MFLLPLISFVIIIWLIVFIMNTLTSNSHNTPGSTNSNIQKTSPHINRPMEILKERYAKGELSEEEYLKIRKNLE